MNRLIELGQMTDELKPCHCGALPVRETQRVMLGRIEDGGYPVTHGRYKCPECDNVPSWGPFYCVDYPGGWEKNAMVWNRLIDKSKEVV